MSSFKFNKCDDYTIILTNRSYVPYGHIANYEVDDISFKKNMNSADEFSFTVYKYMTLEDGTEYEEPLWDKITDFKLVYVKETNTYYEIKVSGTDTFATYKTINATSLCEAELSQYNLYGIEINTEDDIARDDYVQPTIFYRSLDGLEPESDSYNAAKNSSLLHRILYGSGKGNNYTIKHVDESIANLQRSFSIDGTSIYDFLTGDCAEQFNCLFVFDSTDRSISVYDLYSVCMNDDCTYRLDDNDNPNHLRYRGEFNDVCPKCGSKHIKVYGEDTMVIVDKENLTDEISFTTNSDELKNCFHLKAGDDDMTAAIVNINPNGTAYLYYIPEYQREDMSKELVDKITSYDTLYDSYTDEYEKLMLNLYDAIDWQLYYMDEMMPGAIPPDQRESAGSTEITTKPVETSEQQIPKLSVANLNYTAVSSVTSTTSLSTVESALKNYAKVFVDTSKFKIETTEDSLGSVYKDAFENNCIQWTGKFKVTNFSDKNDVATSSTLTITIYDNYTEFINQKIKKSIVSDDSTGSIYDVLKIDDLEKYKEAIKLYGIVRLQSFVESIKNVEDILIQQGNQAQELYYDKYHNMEIVTENELDTRQIQYDAWVDKEAELSTRKSEIQNILNFENYLGSKLYGEFCSYRRDQDYSNDNFISDGLNNADLFTNAREFMRIAKEELTKAGTLQCNISCKVKNLFALDEFEPFWDKFQIGNWITVGVDGEYYRLRLISINGSLSDFSNIDVEFSSVTKISNATTDINDIINQAQSMATNYSYISRQSNNGQKANDTLSEFQKKSMNASLYRLKNNDKEEITINNHGITGKSWDDILEDYSPEQFVFTHNTLGFTDDNFASLKTALGKVLMPDGTYKYGLNAEVVMGTFLLGKYLELQNENGSLKFNGDGFVITNGTNTFTVNPNNKDKLLSISSSSGDIMYVNSDGNVHFCGDISGSTGTFSGLVSGGSININNQFIVDENGNMTAKSGTFSGTLNGADGSFSGGLYGNYINGATIEAGTINGTTITGASGEFTEGFKVDVPFDTNYGSLVVEINDNHALFGAYFDSNFCGIKVDQNYVDICGSPGSSSNFHPLELININDSSMYDAINDLIPSSTSEINASYSSSNYSTIGNNIIKFSNSTSKKAYGATCDYVQKYVADNTSKFITGFSGDSTSGVYNSIQTSGSKIVGSKISYTDLKSKLSDERLKKDISILTKSDIEDFYMNLVPTKHKYKDDVGVGEDNKYQFGVIAQWTEKDMIDHDINPDSYSIVRKSKPFDDTMESEYTNGKDVYRVDYEQFHALHIYMIQKQQKKIENLKAENAELKNKLQNLEDRLKSIEEKLNI